MKKQIINSPFGDEFIKAVHSSGLEIYIIEKPQFSSSFALFGTKYGSIDTAFSKDGGEITEVPEGIAHFLEHKLFESEDGDAFAKYAKTGANANAYTSFDRTCYLFSCSEQFDENLDILLGFVQSPYFTKETVQKEQGIIGQEIKMYDDSPDWRVMFNMLSCMYKHHPVKTEIAGTTESIVKIDASLLYRCYETFYNPSNMFICIAGNVNADKVLKQIDEKIIPHLPVNIERQNFEPEGKIIKHIVEQELAVSIPTFCYGFRHDIGNTMPSLKTKVCISLLLEMICGDTSPLYERLVKKGLINDEFDSEYFCGRGYAAMIFEGESTSPHDVAREIRLEIDSISKKGIDKKQFSAVKCAMYGDSVRQFGTVRGSASSLVDSAVCGYDVYEDIRILKSVTADDVFRYLTEFKEENAVLSIIKPTEKIKSANKGDKK